jgi:hypothetical protein
MESELREHLAMPGHRETRLIRVSANRNEGVKELCDAIL